MVFKIQCMGKEILDLEKNLGPDNRKGFSGTFT